jgi:hypothetical protein
VLVALADEDIADLGKLLAHIRQDGFQNVLL